MKRFLCVWVLWGLSAWAVAQEVSFSVAESGTGRQADIARIVGLSEGNVRVRIHRIKQLLTEKFRKYGE